MSTMCGVSAPHMNIGRQVIGATEFKHEVLPWPKCTLRIGAQLQFYMWLLETVDGIKFTVEVLSAVHLREPMLVF